MLSQSLVLIIDMALFALFIASVIGWFIHDRMIEINRIKVLESIIADIDKRLDALEETIDE